VPATRAGGVSRLSGLLAACPRLHYRLLTLCPAPLSVADAFKAGQGVGGEGGGHRAMRPCLGARRARRVSCRRLRASVASPPRPLTGVTARTHTACAQPLVVTRPVCVCRQEASRGQQQGAHKDFAHQAPQGQAAAVALSAHPLSLFGACQRWSGGVPHHGLARQAWRPLSRGSCPRHFGSCAHHFDQTKTRQEGSHQGLHSGHQGLHSCHQGCTLANQLTPAGTSSHELTPAHTLAAPPLQHLSCRHVHLSCCATYGRN